MKAMPKVMLLFNFSSECMFCCFCIAFDCLLFIRTHFFTAPYDNPISMYQDVKRYLDQFKLETHALLDLHKFATLCREHTDILTEEPEYIMFRYGHLFQCEVKMTVNGVRHISKGDKCVYKKSAKASASFALLK